MKRTAFSLPIGIKALTAGVLAASLFAFALAGCSSPAPSPSDKGGGSSGGDTSTAASLYQSKCSACHSLATVDNATYTGSDQWKAVVKRMQLKTDAISDDDVNTITDYLANR